MVISDSKRTSVLSRRVITIHFPDSVRHSRFSHPASSCLNIQGDFFLGPPIFGQMSLAFKLGPLKSLRETAHPI